MSKVLDVVKHEIREAVFPAIYFLVLFHFAVATKILLLDSYNVTPVVLASATVMALVVAKAILIIDALPISRRFAHRPLYQRILWKTFTYGALVSLFRVLEELIPQWIKYGSLSEAGQNLIHDISWPHFWVIQMWLVASIVGYSFIAGFDEHLGKGSVKRALLSARHRDQSIPPEQE